MFDLQENDFFVGDLSQQATLERFAQAVIDRCGHVDYLINNAAPKMCGLADGSYDDFEYIINDWDWDMCQIQMNFMDIENQAGLKGLKLAAIETHVADARTCCLHPATATHRQMNEEELIAAGVPGDLVRYSCGIENADDLIADIENAQK